jgi:Protein of unknown function (DUF2877)
VPGPSSPALPAVADALLAPLLRGPPRPAEVVVATPLAVYARLEDGSVVAVLAPRAVRVPGSVVVSGTPGSGEEILLGGGGVELGGIRLVPRRWWDSRVPEVGAPAEPPALGPPPDVAGDPADLERVLTAGEDVARVVERLVGLGPGLTPAGDDVLAGALVALAATGADAARRRLAADVLRLRHRTTMVSAALLGHAADGRAVPELARYVVALSRGRLDAGVVQDLERVGGTSGEALAFGARVGLRAAARARDHGKAAEAA